MNTTLPVIDDEALGELLACDPTGELLTELIDVFLEDTPPRMDAVRLALHAGDPAALANEAHALKSSTAQMGARRLSHCCRELERLGREGTLTGAEAHVQALFAGFPAVRTELLARRND